MKNCPSCGTENFETAFKCSKCSEVLKKPREKEEINYNIPSYLVHSIIVTLCCCSPPGIVAIVYAAQVRAKLQEDDYSGAAYCSQKAKMWAVIGFALGLMSIIIYFMVEGFKY